MTALECYFVIIIIVTIIITIVIINHYHDFVNISVLIIFLNVEGIFWW